MLTQAIREYWAASERGDAAGQQEQLRWICAAMARLLEQRLQAHEQWSRWHWVDDVLPYAAVARSSTECEVRGLAVWGEGGSTNQWYEPFAGSVRVDGEGNLVAYALHFADAAVGLRRMSEKARRSYEAGLSAPREWQFSFVKTEHAR